MAGETTMVQTGRALVAFHEQSARISGDAFADSQNEPLRNAAAKDLARADALRALLDDHDQLRTQLAQARAQLQKDSDESDALLGRLSTILTATANALKGEPAPLSQHSWHDLAEVATQLRKPQPETAWLIEQPTISGPAWFSGDPRGKGWSYAHDAAIRFAREIDAKLAIPYLHGVTDRCIVTEHVWLHAGGA
jgi:hypothetical protein